MGESRHTLHPWRKSSLDELVETQPIVKPQPIIEPQPIVDLGQITASFYGGCMGLPQEVVERILGMLQSDKRALEACSLTCKAMFTSSRHLIHQTLYITRENNRRILTPEESKHVSQMGYPRWSDHPGLELRFLSFMGERDLLKYTRCLKISIGNEEFSPTALEPHLQHFRSLDRVHTLVIHSYHAPLWHNIHDTYFTQFYSTMTTLTLHHSVGHYRSLLLFALQFPNLENITFERLQHSIWMLPGMLVPPVVTGYPPLRGHLRCSVVDASQPEWTKEFAFGPPGGINFRSIELQDVYWRHGQWLLDGCANSLEELTVHTAENEYNALGRLSLRKNSSLRSIVIRTPFSNLYKLATTPLWKSLSTITSTALSEFVLDLSGSPSEFTLPALEINLWGDWSGIDEILGGFLDRCCDFKLVVRTGTLSDRDGFQAQAEKKFPLMAWMSRIEFETRS